MALSLSLRKVLSHLVGTPMLGTFTGSRFTLRNQPSVPTSRGPEKLSFRIASKGLRASLACPCSSFELKSNVKSWPLFISSKPIAPKPARCDVAPGTAKPTIDLAPLPCEKAQTNSRHTASFTIRLCCLSPVASGVKDHLRNSEALVLPLRLFGRVLKKVNACTRPFCTGMLLLTTGSRRLQ